MALEKDQERPTSPLGSRRIKMKNMNYILDPALKKESIGSIDQMSHSDISQNSVLK
jgi:hypothetical protein